MAKLTAHGRTELVRLMIHMATPADETVIWRKTHYVVMSDRTLLVKHQVRFRATDFSPERNHDWGWKVKGKLTARAFDNLEDWVAKYEKLDWEVTWK
jgi:hypothetical protein